MAKSILQTERECYICGRLDVEEHHCIHGSSNRKNAERCGLKVWLCWKHHKKLHEDRDMDLYFIRLAQSKFEETHTREEFMAIFGKNWLD
jgi:hypothetical protein